MKKHFQNLTVQLIFFGLVLTASGVFSSNTLAQGFNINVGSATVDITPGTAFVNASIDIAIENPTADALEIAGYTFFLDIDPAGSSLPGGVSFGAPAGTYSSGNGAGLLLGANIDGTLNLNPAAGDLGLGQIQSFNASVAAGVSEKLLTVNLLIDLGTAVAGDYTVSISTDGQNSISSTNNLNQQFTTTSGTLTLAVPDPFLLGDVDMNGVVNFLDISPFISVLTSGAFKDEADIDRNGVVNFLDISPFIGILSAS